MPTSMFISRSVSSVAARNIFLDVSLGTRPRYSLVVDEGVEKPAKQSNKQIPAIIS